MKKILLIVFSLLLTVSLLGTANAADEFVFDDYSAIQNIESLNETAVEIAEKTGYIVSCAITESVDGMNGNEQAQHIFEEKFGSSSEGMLFLDCIDTQNYYVYFSDEMNHRLTQTDAMALFQAYDSRQEKEASVRAYLEAASRILLPLAENAAPEEMPFPENSAFSRVVDLAEVISQSELESLNAYADSLSEQYQCDIAVVFVESTAPKNAQAFADDFYDDNGFGYGENDDGILLLIAVKDRQYAISTYGYGIRAFSDYDLDSIIGKFRGYLSGGSWAAAANEFIKDCGDVLYRKAYEPDYGSNYGPQYGSPIQQNTLSPVSPTTLIPINIAVGLIIGFIIVSSMKRKHTSVRKQTQAFNYLRDGSFMLSYSNDRFINSHLDRVRKPEPQNRTSGHGGGSTHFSSSGRTHGGRSGGF